MASFTRAVDGPRSRLRRAGRSDIARKEAVSGRPTAIDSPTRHLIVQPIPRELRGGWCLVRLRGVDAATQTVVGMTIERPRGLIWSELACSVPRGRPSAAWIVLFVPRDATVLRCGLIGGDADIGRSRLSFRRVSRVAAAALVLGRAMRTRPGAVLRLLAGRPSALPDRLRRGLAVLAVSEFWPRDYHFWIDQFEPATLVAADRFAAAARPPTVRVMAFGAASVPACIRDTHPCLAAQAAHSGPDADYVAVLQAGEVLRPDALKLLAGWAEMLGRPPIIMADEDRLDHGGRRVAPLFKPRLSHTAMLSGTLCGGVWLIRSDVLDRVPARARSAHGLRLAVWLALWRDGVTCPAARLPVVLTSLTFRAARPNAGELAGIVNDHLRASGLPMEAFPTPAPAMPLRLRVDPARVARHRVRIVIASRCRGDIALRCLRAVLATTVEQDVDVVLVLAQPTPPDADQRAFLEKLVGDPRMHPRVVAMTAFNFAAASNAGARGTEAEFVLLLNDDIEPRERGWLSVLLGHMADPRVGVVGAKLLYPDGTVQHCGLVLGRPGQCHHVARLLPAGAPGYAWRNHVTQEFSAVTGACLLTRTAIFDDLGGLDEAYASAFNDVDYCLRAREAGWQVVLSTQSRIIHHESMSFGAYFRGEYAASELADTARFSARWSGMFGRDPFYSSNLSIATGCLDEVAFPPRAPASD